MQVRLSSVRKGGNSVRLATVSGFCAAFLAEQADITKAFSNSPTAHKVCMLEHAKTARARQERLSMGCVAPSMLLRNTNRQGRAERRWGRACFSLPGVLSVRVG